MDEKNQKIGADAKIHLHTSEKFENFWYHYKWHTIAAIFVLVVGIILTLQLCTKTSYDMHLIYAGEKAIRMSSLSGDGKSEYSDIVEVFQSMANDTNNDGNVNVNLQSLQILSQKEYEEATKDITDPMVKERMESEIMANSDTLYNYIMYGDYYLCLLSEDIFLHYEELLDSSIFAPLESYLPKDRDFEFASERGVYISSLDVYESGALSILPEDTVVCIRLPGVLGARDDGKSYANAENLLRALLSYKN